MEPDYVEAKAWFPDYPRALRIRDYEPGASYGDLPLGSCVASKANIDNMTSPEHAEAVNRRKAEIRNMSENAAP